jgi:hypothetical protein
VRQATQQVARSATNFPFADEVGVPTPRDSFARSNPVSRPHLGQPPCVRVPEEAPSHIRSVRSSARCSGLSSAKK